MGDMKEVDCLAVCLAPAVLGLVKTGGCVAGAAEVFYQISLEYRFFSLLLSFF